MAKPASTRVENTSFDSCRETSARENIVAASRRGRREATGRPATPTELLAEQHWQNFSRWLAPLGIEPLLLTGRLTPRARRDAQIAVAEGSRSIVIGTHALFQEDVVFGRLALVIVDEQHRFGVHQRLRMRQKGADGRYPHHDPHAASRTRSMTRMRSRRPIIEELPPGARDHDGRMPIRARRDRAAHPQRLPRGAPGYWVCPLSRNRRLEAGGGRHGRGVRRLARPRRGSYGRMPAHARERPWRIQGGEIGLLVARP